MSTSNLRGCRWRIRQARSAAPADTYFLGLAYGSRLAGSMNCTLYVSRFARSLRSRNKDSDASDVKVLPLRGTTALTRAYECGLISRTDEP